MNNLNISPTKNTKFEEENAINYAKHLLKGRTFTGNYREKQFIKELEDYRDVVTINNNQTHFINDLKLVLKRLYNAKLSMWIGITPPEMVGTPAFYTIWTQLDAEVFGEYNFKVKTIKIWQKEIMVQLKRVGEVQNLSDQSFEFDLEEIKMNFKRNMIEAYNLMTFHNFKQTVMFLFVLLVTVFTGGVAFVKGFADFFLKFLNGASTLIHSMTPIFITFIKAGERIIMGVIYAITVLLSGRQNPPPQPVRHVPYQQIGYNRRNMLEYRPHYNNRHGVIITEIE